MAFTVADFRDLTRLLEERPDWREELRRLVLTDRLLALPDQIAEQRLETDRRFQEASAQIARLAETQERLIQELGALTRTVLGLVDDVGKLKGSDLERRLRERSFAHFGRLIRRAHVLTQEELADVLDAGKARGAITEREADELTWTDLIVRGSGVTTAPTCRSSWRSPTESDSVTWNGPSAELSSMAGSSRPYYRWLRARRSPLKRNSAPDPRVCGNWYAAASSHRTPYPQFGLPRPDRPASRFRKLGVAASSGATCCAKGSSRRPRCSRGPHGSAAIRCRSIPDA